jgi:hypothetical protein
MADAADLERRKQRMPRILFLMLLQRNGEEVVSPDIARAGGAFRILVSGLERWYAWGIGSLGHELKPLPGYNLQGFVRHSPVWAKMQTFDYYWGSAELGYERENDLSREQVTERLGWGDVDDNVVGLIFDRLGSDGVYDVQNWSFMTAENLLEISTKGEEVGSDRYPPTIDARL